MGPLMHNPNWVSANSIILPEMHPKNTDPKKQKHRQNINSFGDPFSTLPLPSWNRVTNTYSYDIMFDNGLTEFLVQL